FASKRCTDACRLSIFVGSTPAGGGITTALTATRAKLTTPPTTRPAITAKIFRIIGLMCLGSLITKDVPALFDLGQKVLLFPGRDHYRPAAAVFDPQSVERQCG